MKILFLHSLADPHLGGAEVVMWTNLLGMRDAGHECVLLVASNEPGLQRIERDGITIWQAGIRNIYWPYHKNRPALPLRMLWHVFDSFNPWMQGYIRRVVAQEKPDVASVHSLPSWSAASWRTLAQVGVPIVQVLHDYYSVCSKTTMHRGGNNCVGQCVGCKMLRLPHRMLSRRIQAAVAVSHFVLNRHQALGYFKNVPIQRVIHNVRAPQDLGLGESIIAITHTGLRFGFIGRLDPTKGIEALIYAFLTANLSDAELWIAGSGKQDYESRLRCNTQDGRILFLGYMTPRDFYPHVDVVVVPSLCNEALGMVVAEALAFGKPVIGSRRGGIPEMISDGENGLLFEPDSPGELVHILRQIHADTLLREHLAANTIQSSRPFIDISAWVASYEALYREVVDNQLSQIRE